MVARKCWSKLRAKFRSERRDDVTQGDDSGGIGVCGNVVGL